MPALLLLSAHQLAGKTTIATGLARRIRAAGRVVAFTRIPGDESGEADSELFERLGRSTSAPPSPSGPEVSLIEAPSGDPNSALTENPDARAIVVRSAAQIEPPLIEYAGAIGDRLAGVIVNKAPSKRLDSIRTGAEGTGLKVLAVVPEDRLLAAPVLRDVAGTLSATVEHLGDGGLQPLDRPLIATISADPGQGYFAGYDAKAVIVRSDKPDLQLAALNAGASCLILTGGLPLLSYVLERAEEDEIPLVRTSLDTISAVNGIEGLFGSVPFAGGDAKTKRITDLLADLDIQSLIE
jgi:BioD-like phosphotransacetylase family protein